MSLVSIICVIVCTLTAAALGFEERIVMTHVLFRHGDRSPIVTYKTNKYNESNWPQGYAQLTNLGMRQHYELGTFLRSKYIEGKPHGLLNSSYNRLEVEVRSTDVDRTLMSAAANLAALYPPHGDQIWKEDLLWQPIPIHTVPKSEDNLLNMDSPCPTYNKIHEDVMKSEEVNKLRKDYKEFFEFVKNKTEKYDLDINNIWEIHDVIFCEFSHNFSLPEWINERFYGKSVFELLNDFNSIQFDLMFNRKNEAKLKGGSLLHKVLNDTKTMVAGTADVKKAYIYSAHDDTITAFLSAMKIFNYKSPPYAACVMIDIFERNLGNGTAAHFVSVSYRNSTTADPYVLSLPGCEDKCPLDTFLKLTELNALKDWHKACYAEQFPNFFYIGLLIALGLPIIMVALLLSLALMPKFRRNHLPYSPL